MFTFEQAGPKEWHIIVSEDESYQILLSPSSVTNKFHIVTDFITRVAEFHGEDFSEWFIGFIKNCMDETKRAATVTARTVPSVRH